MLLRIVENIISIWFALFCDLICLAGVQDRSLFRLFGGGEEFCSALWDLGSYSHMGGDWRRIRFSDVLRYYFRIWSAVSNSFRND
ncbi:hypothetical protein CEXT_76531 [Caerostris extrusa]|uniref:Secreted protein n=1 Tax=Caerostris extrusa TaxID=172846 RepID=A0AAV4M4T4_CAEEX|nr:hypothetical protein CEXT_76531 [Caerostris extrusa]